MWIKVQWFYIRLTVSSWKEIVNKFDCKIIFDLFANSTNRRLWVRISAPLICRGRVFGFKHRERNVVACIFVWIGSWFLLLFLQRFCWTVCTSSVRLYHLSRLRFITQYLSGKSRHFARALLSRASAPNQRSPRCRRCSRRKPGVSRGPSSEFYFAFLLWETFWKPTFFIQ